MFGLNVFGELPFLIGILETRVVLSAWLVLAPAPVVRVSKIEPESPVRAENAFHFPKHLHEMGNIQFGLGFEPQLAAPASTDKAGVGYYLKALFLLAYTGELWIALRVVYPLMFGISPLMFLAWFLIARPYLWLRTV